MWQMNDAFMAAKTAAANVPGDGEAGSYTAAMFQEDFPQFLDEEKNSLVPEKILDQFISQANDSVLPSRWGSMWHYAAGLYTAHFSALYLQTYAPASASAAAGSGKSTADRSSQVGNNGRHYHQL